MNSNILKKNFIWNLLGVTINAFVSLFLMVIVTRINGVSDAGIFTFAFSVSCLLFTIGIYAGRTFQVTDNKDYTSYDYLFHRGVCGGVMLLIAVIWIFISDCSREKGLVILLLSILKAQEAFCDTVYGIFQINGHLYKAGFSMFMKALFGVLIFGVVDYITGSLRLSCLLINFVWLSIFFIYDLRNLKREITCKKFSVLNGMKLFKKGMFAFLFNFLLIYIVNAPKYAMDNYLSDDLQAILGIIIMPATLISLCGQYLLNPFLNNMKAKYREKERKSFEKIIRDMGFILFGAGVCAIAIIRWIGLKIMELVYGVKLEEYSKNIYVIILGGVLYAMTMVLSTALTTMRKTFMQFVVNVCIAIIGLIGSHICIKLYALNGASIIYFIIMFLQCLGYWCIYRFYLKKEFL